MVGDNSLRFRFEQRFEFLCLFRLFSQEAGECDEVSACELIPQAEAGDQLGVLGHLCRGHMDGLVKKSAPRLEAAPFHLAPPTRFVEFRPTGLRRTADSA